VVQQTRDNVHWQTRLKEITKRVTHILYCPNDALNYINCRVIKNTLKI